MILNDYSLSGHAHHEEWVGHPMEVCSECMVPWPCETERDARRICLGCRGTGEVPREIPPKFNTLFDQCEQCHGTGRATPVPLQEG